MSIGKVIKYIRPVENNPRNSEGAFYTFPDGRIIFIYSRYKGTSDHDGATADLFMLESLDNGESFTDVGTVFTCEELGGANIMSVSLLEMRDGSVGLFFIKKFSNYLDTIMLSKSYDEGKTWTEPKRIILEDGYYVLNNDRVIRLQDGRIVFPVSSHWIHDVTSKAGKKMFFEPGIVFIYGSDDDENFYRLSRGYTINNSKAGGQEPLLIQHKDGRLECYIRTDIGCQLRIEAKDESLHDWSEPERTGFVSLEAPISMKYIDDNTLLAIWSSTRDDVDSDHFVWAKNRITAGRSYYVYALSYDGGKSFTEPRELEFDLTRGFCYCAIHCVGDSILLAYCSGGGGEENGCLDRITIRKIKKSEL